MFLRVLFVSLLLGALIFVQVRETRTYFGDVQTFHYLLIAFIYFLTFIYILLLKRLQRLSRLAYVQLLVDTLFITALIYTTGGIESIFSFLYILTIINASIILYRKGGLVIASSSSILYGTLLDLHYYGVIHPFGSRLVYPGEYQSFFILYIILVNIAAFYLVGFLSSYLSEQTRKSRVELKAKQDDILKLEALNDRIIQSMTSGLITIDGKNRIILFNPTAEKVFNIRGHQVIGRQVAKVLPFLVGFLEDAQSRSYQNKSKSHHFIDVPYVKPDGRRLFLQFSISPLRLGDGVEEGKILFFHDMTEIKEIEEEMKKVEGLALIGELAAGIAHEIRNPMASISGSIQMLKEGLDKADVNNRLMEIILRETDRLNHLINDFLLFARPKQASMQQFDLNQLINESLDLFKNSGKWSSGLTLETHFHDDIHLESDPAQVKQVLWNLFLNATEAMPDGGTLQVGTDMLDGRLTTVSRQRTVRVSVRDTGQGFSDQALSHLFTPFFTTKKGGSGLGLATVKRIMDGLKGTVHARNHPEGGAEITLVLHDAFSHFS
jgi:two-component system sensor histidine kinase PilS (NtrC family)